MTSTTLSYREIGATRDETLPAGYHHLSRRRGIGRGETCFRAAAEALLTWRMHKGAGLTVTASAPRAAPGVTMTSRVGFGPLRMSAPCEVVWADDTPRRAGFGYGTLTGHPESGEEAFLITLGPDSEVVFEVRAFSRPATLLARASGPVGHLLQSLVAARYTRALRRLAASDG